MFHVEHCLARGDTPGSIARECAATGARRQSSAWQARAIGRGGPDRSAPVASALWRADDEEVAYS